MTRESDVEVATRWGRAARDGDWEEYAALLADDAARWIDLGFALAAAQTG